METKYIMRNGVMPSSNPGETAPSKIREREREALIKKLAAKLNESEKNVRLLVSERRMLVGLLNWLIRSGDDDDEDEDDDRIDLEDIDCDDDHVILDGDDESSFLPVFRRPESDGDVFLLSEQYVDLLRRKCRSIRRCLMTNNVGRSKRLAMVTKETERPKTLLTTSSSSSTTATSNNQSNSTTPSSTNTNPNSSGGSSKTSSISLTSPTPPSSSASSSSSSLNQHHHHHNDATVRVTTTITTKTTTTTMKQSKPSNSISTSAVMAGLSMTTNVVPARGTAVNAAVLKTQTVSHLANAAAAVVLTSSSIDEKNSKYELSEEMRQREIEFMCRRYGGFANANRAACLIQARYRQYRMAKNYDRICENTIAKRRSLNPVLSGAFDITDEKLMRQQTQSPPTVAAAPPQPQEQLSTSTSSTSRSLDLPSVDFEHRMEEMAAVMSPKSSVIESDDDHIRAPEVVAAAPIGTLAVAAGKSSNINNTVSVDVSSLSILNYKNLDDEENDDKAVVYHRNATNRHHRHHNHHHHRHHFSIDDDEIEDDDDGELDEYEYENYFKLVGEEQPRRRRPEPAAADHTMLNNTGVSSSLRSRSSVGSGSAATSTTTTTTSIQSSPNSSTKPATTTTTTTKPIRAVSARRKQRRNGVSSPPVSSPTHPPSNVSQSAADLNKHKYLVGLNLFNRKPERGINYLIEEKFLERNPRQIAEFLFNRNCISKQMIGEYISNTQDKLIRSVLNEFVQLMDFTNMPIDTALRRFQTYFRMPGEAQKIEHLTRTFANHYLYSNGTLCRTLFSCPQDTIEVLSYAIILLNTTLHNPNVKMSDRMKFEQFARMTKGIDGGRDLNEDYVRSIYERVKQEQFVTGRDHTTAVMEFERQVVNGVGAGLKGQFVLPHRRLVCIVQLYEVIDLMKKDKPNAHLRDCFLFNDTLVITKIFSKKKSNTLYTFKYGFALNGMNVVLFSTNHYQYGIRLIRMPEKKVLITLNARNENDQQLFCRDLAEAIAESNELESIRIRTELDKINKPSPLPSSISSSSSSQSGPNKTASQAASTSIAQTTTTTTTTPNSSSSSSSSASPSSHVNLGASNASSHRDGPRSHSSAVRRHDLHGLSPQQALTPTPSSTMTQSPSTLSSAKTTATNPTVKKQHSTVAVVVKMAHSMRPSNGMIKRTMSNSMLDLVAAASTANNLDNNPTTPQTTHLYRAGSDCSIFNATQEDDDFTNRTQTLTQTQTQTQTADIETVVERLDNEEEDNKTTKLSNNNNISRTIEKVESRRWFAMNHHVTTTTTNIRSNGLKPSDLGDIVLSAAEMSSSATNNNSNHKYFTMGSAAGNKFRQIIKRYV